MSLRFGRKMGTTLFGAKPLPVFSQLRTFIYEVVPLDPKVSLRLDFNVLKDAPKIEELPDAEYPEWLWNVTKPHPTMYELSKLDKEELSGFMLKRHFKLSRKALIKEANMIAKK